jgi:hypothetical protein
VWQQQIKERDEATRREAEADRRRLEELMRMSQTFESINKTAEQRKREQVLRDMAVSKALVKLRDDHRIPAAVSSEDFMSYRVSKKPDPHDTQALDRLIAEKETVAAREREDNMKRGKEISEDAAAFHHEQRENRRRRKEVATRLAAECMRIAEQQKQHRHDEQTSTRALDSALPSIFGGLDFLQATQAQKEILSMRQKQELAQHQRRAIEQREQEKRQTAQQYRETEKLIDQAVRLRDFERRQLRAQQYRNQNTWQRQAQERHRHENAEREAADSFKESIFFCNESSDDEAK